MSGAGDVHRPSGPLPKAKFYKNIKAALESVGYPKSAWDFFNRMDSALTKADEVRMAERLEERGTLDRQGCYVTDAAKECGRALFFSYNNTPETNPPDAYARLLFILGHAAEEAIARVFEGAGHQVEREKRIEFIRDGVTISGRIDFVIDDTMELKTTQGDKFKWTVSRGEAGKAEHRTQLNLYLHHRNLEGLVTGKGTLLYVITDAPKGTPSVLPYAVYYDAGQAEKDLERLVLLWKMAQADMDPGIPKEYLEVHEQEGKLPLWPCGYCRFRSICTEQVEERGAA